MGLFKKLFPQSKLSKYEREEKKKHKEYVKLEKSSNVSFVSKPESVVYGDYVFERLKSIRRSRKSPVAKSKKLANSEQGPSTSFASPPNHLDAVSTRVTTGDDNEATMRKEIKIDGVSNTDSDKNLAKVAKLDEHETKLPTNSIKELQPNNYVREEKEAAAKAIPKVRKRWKQSAPTQPNNSTANLPEVNSIQNLIVEDRQLAAPKATSQAMDVTDAIEKDKTKSEFNSKPHLEEKTYAKRPSTTTTTSEEFYDCDDFSDIEDQNQSVPSKSEIVLVHRNDEESKEKRLEKQLNADDSAIEGVEYYDQFDHSLQDESGDQQKYGPFSIFDVEFPDDLDHSTDDVLNSRIKTVLETEKYSLVQELMRLQEKDDLVDEELGFNDPFEVQDPVVEAKTRESITETRIFEFKGSGLYFDPNESDHNQLVTETVSPLKIGSGQSESADDKDATQKIPIIQINSSQEVDTAETTNFSDINGDEFDSDFTEEEPSVSFNWYINREVQNNPDRDLTNTDGRGRNSIVEKAPIKKSRPLSEGYLDLEIRSDNEFFLPSKKLSKSDEYLHANTHTKLENNKLNFLVNFEDDQNEIMVNHKYDDSKKIETNFNEDRVNQLGKTEGEDFQNSVYEENAKNFNDVDSIKRQLNSDKSINSENFDKPKEKGDPEKSDRVEDEDFNDLLLKNVSELNSPVSSPNFIFGQSNRQDQLLSNTKYLFGSSDSAGVKQNEETLKEKEFIDGERSIEKNGEAFDTDEETSQLQQNTDEAFDSYSEYLNWRRKAQQEKLVDANLQFDDTDDDDLDWRTNEEIANENKSRVNVWDRIPASEFTIEEEDSWDLYEEERKRRVDEGRNKENSGEFKKIVPNLQPITWSFEQDTTDESVHATKDESISATKNESVSASKDESVSTTNDGHSAKENLLQNENIANTNIKDWKSKERGQEEEVFRIKPLNGGENKTLLILHDSSASSNPDRRREELESVVIRLEDNDEDMAKTHDEEKVQTQNEANILDENDQIPRSLAVPQIVVEEPVDLSKPRQKVTKKVSFRTVAKDVQPEDDDRYAMTTYDRYIPVHNNASPVEEEVVIRRSAKLEELSIRIARKSERPTTLPSILKRTNQENYDKDSITLPRNFRLHQSKSLQATPVEANADLLKLQDTLDSISDRKNVEDKVKIMEEVAKEVKEKVDEFDRARNNRDYAQLLQVLFKSVRIISGLSCGFNTDLLNRQQTILSEIQKNITTLSSK